MDVYIRVDPFFCIVLEFRSWVLYYSLPVLHGSLPDIYFSHYALLVTAMHIFLGENINQPDFRRAELYITKFYEMFADLYGMLCVHVHVPVIHQCIFQELMVAP